MPTNQVEESWNNRQPTPDLLQTEAESNGDQSNQSTEEVDQNISENVSDYTNENTNENVNDCANNGASEKIVSDSSIPQDSMLEGDDPQSRSLDATCPGDNDDNDVFGDFEGYKEDDSLWLRNAISVCSEGEDIEQLASEALDFYPATPKDASCNIDNDDNGYDASSNSGRIAECSQSDANAGTERDDEEVDAVDANAKSAADYDALARFDVVISNAANADADADADADGINLSKISEIQNSSEEIDGDALAQQLCDLPVLSSTFTEETQENSGLEFLDSSDLMENSNPGAVRDKAFNEIKNLSQCAVGNVKLIEEDSSSGSSRRNRTSPLHGNDRENGSCEIDDAFTTGEGFNGRDSSSPALQGPLPLSATITKSDSVEDKTGEDSLTGCTNAQNNRFSISYDDKLKRRIQKVIEDDDYIYQSSLAMSEAIELEDQKRYKAAFKMYKLGIGLLLEGVQQDTEEERRFAVRRKTAQYLLRAENVYKCCQMQVAQTARARKKPIHLSECRTIGITDNIILVERLATSEIFALKVLHKCGAEYKNRKGATSKRGSRFIDSKYMVKLCHKTESSTGIHLLLEFIPGGLLWDQLDMDFSWNSSSFELIKNLPSASSVSASKARSRLLNSKKYIERTESDSEDAKLPEEQVRIWIAEIVSVISDLHKLDIICR